MNQNNVNRQQSQVTPEEVQQQVSQMTPEELQRTQVINLKDLEEVVKFEKRTSKKPAIIVAVIAIALILSGSGAQIATTLKEKKKEEQVIAQRKEEELRKTSLTCTQNKLNNSNGTDAIYSFRYEFEDDLVIKANKMLSVTVTPGKENGKAEIKKLKDNYEKNKLSIRGYENSISTTDKGFVLVTEIDYRDLKPDEVKSTQIKDLATSVDYEEGALKNTIIEDMTKKNFTCK